MITLKDKVVGSYYGMALGNAMGLSAKSLKPDPIQQLFGSMDGFKDVIPYIGKGVKQYKMKGLYGSQTQSALVISDSLLKNKKVDPKIISHLLLKMSANGPEHYFGTFRQPGKSFFQSVTGLTEDPPRTPEHNIADATFLSMGIPAGLLHRERPEIGIHLNIAIGLMMSRNLCEITGLALTGYIASRLLQFEPEKNNDSFEQTELILRDVETFCQKIENQLKKTAPDLWETTPESEHGMLEKTIKNPIIEEPYVIKNYIDNREDIETYYKNINDMKNAKQKSPINYKIKMNDTYINNINFQGTFSSIFLCEYKNPKVTLKYVSKYKSNDNNENFISLPSEFKFGKNSNYVFNYNIQFIISNDNYGYPEEYKYKFNKECKMSYDEKLDLLKFKTSPKNKAYSGDLVFYYNESNNSMSFKSCDIEMSETTFYDMALPI
jgi:hypothetical protein